MHMNNPRFLLALLAAILAFQPAHAMPTDTDGDGISDTLDNCTLAANPGQEDGDGDGHGNHCDADMDNSCGAVNIFDLFAFKAAFGTADPVADLNASGGAVNIFDLFAFKALFGAAPGPSAPGSLCNPDSDSDGVADTNDLCPGTPPGSTVDVDGCIIGVSWPVVNSAVNNDVDMAVGIILNSMTLSEKVGQMVMAEISAVSVLMLPTSIWVPYSTAAAPGPIKTRMPPLQTGWHWLIVFIWPAPTPAMAVSAYRPYGAPMQYTAITMLSAPQSFRTISGWVPRTIPF